MTKLLKNSTIRHPYLGTPFTANLPDGNGGIVEKPLTVGLAILQLLGGAWSGENPPLEESVKAHRVLEAAAAATNDGDIRLSDEQYEWLVGIMRAKGTKVYGAISASPVLEAFRDVRPELAAT